MHWIAEKTAAALIARGAPEDDREVYVYALETLLSILCMIACFILLGLATGRLLDIVIWQAALLALRVPMGGYHASTHFRCQLMSFSLAIFCLLVIPFLPVAVCIALGVATGIIAWRIAPVVHPDQPQSVKERRRARILALIVAGGELLAICLLCGFDLTPIAAIVATGGACASIPALYAYKVQHALYAADGE